MKNVIVFSTLAAIAIAIGFYFVLGGTPPKNQSIASGEAQIGGGFSLTDHNNRQVTDSEFRGKYMLVFFGFTQCPDICPPGLTTLTRVMEDLDSKNKEVVPLFITIDPKRDTPERMKEFLANFHPAIIGLTGSEEATKNVVSAYKVYSSKVPDNHHADHYTMDHSGHIYLMDREGKYVAHFSYNGDPVTIATKVKSYL